MSDLHADHVRGSTVVLVPTAKRVIEADDQRRYCAGWSAYCELAGDEPCQGSDAWYAWHEEWLRLASVMLARFN